MPAIFSAVNRHFSPIILSKMSGKGKISSFFKPKRKASSDEKDSPSKKAKIGVNDAGIDNPSTLPSEKNKEVNTMDKRQANTSSDLLINVGSSWLPALESEFSKPYFLQLSKFVETERNKGSVFPPADQVFAWTNTCPIDQVKVVILGQDPYHGLNQAHGLCFSVQKGIASPPSLVNMYKELESDIKGFKKPDHGTLTGWANQGVLLLNAVLTVRAHNANSHKDKGWEKLTDAVIRWINNNLSGVVFMLWGGYAQKKGAFIDKKKHYVLKAVHPSPLSAHRGFFGCKHFSLANDYLQKQGKEPIDWSALD